MSPNEWVHRLRKAATRSALVLVWLSSGFSSAKGQLVDTLSANLIGHAIISDVHVPPGGSQQSQTALAFFTAMGWQNYQIWMYTDDQRFNTDGVFGPVAFIAPADGLDTLTMEDFATSGRGGVLVGAILVDTLSRRPVILPESYRALRLVAGISCVRLNLERERWRAYVYPARAGENPCAPPDMLPEPLDVRQVMSSAFEGHSNIPPVARFHEGTRGRRGRIHFGLKCAEAWCMILPTTGDSLRLPHKGAHPTRRTWEVHGWHDVQHLAVLNTAGKPIPSALRASMIPDTALGSYTIAQNFDTGFVHTATIVMHSNPGRTKYGRRPHPDARGYWNLMRGENELFLRTDPGSPSGWRAEVRNASGRFELVVLDRHPHNRPVPGTARFRWVDHDDGGWIRCDDGCCKVGPG